MQRVTVPKVIDLGVRIGDVPSVIARHKRLTIVTGQTLSGGATRLNSVHSFPAMCSHRSRAMLSPTFIHTAMKLHNSLLASFAAGALAGPVQAQTDVRFATFNLSLNRNAEGQLLSDLANPNFADPNGTTEQTRIEQARRDAEIIQRVNPDVLLLNEFDYNNASSGTAAYEALNRFENNFLNVAQNRISGTSSAAATSYLHSFVAPSNTGITSGFDLNNNGIYDNTPGDGAYGDDSFGFGEYPGKFAMGFYSKYPIVASRTFQNFLWKDMPGSLLTNDPTPAGANNLGTFYSSAERDVLRLSSKSHWDLTLDINGT
ncbi:MAG: endonuclease/exonuclease/phosphatase family protein, partial [Chthoniobacteraceae bacterium]